MMDSEDNDLLSTNSAAAEAKCHARTLLTAAAAGLLRCHRLRLGSRAVLAFKRADVIAFGEQRRAAKRTRTAAA